MRRRFVVIVPQTSDNLKCGLRQFVVSSDTLFDYLEDAFLVFLLPKREALAGGAGRLEISAANMTGRGEGEP